MNAPLSTAGLIVEADAPKDAASVAPLLTRSDHRSPSVFRPENMLREARRQKNLSAAAVAPVCILDPDGDIVRYARQNLGAHLARQWACYHTSMWEWTEGPNRYCVVGSAVGASFAVLVAEQLFASGCKLAVSVASAGQIADLGPPPYFVLIDRAIRDEGTSYHYLAPERFAHADKTLISLAANALSSTPTTVYRGASWTTDAPFRETAESIAARREEGALTVEMEAAGLYAFGRARAKPVICVAHVTNQLGCVEGDFEKGDHNGAEASLALVRTVSEAWNVAQAVRRPPTP